MRITYNKLVRDRIPEIIAADGRAFATTILDEQAYRQALAVKLVEEAQETQAALVSGVAADVVKEAADLLEVLDALLAALDIDKAPVLAKQRQRRQERGGFTQRLQLLWADGDP